MSDIGYAAANIGERDLSNGYEAFTALTKDVKFPLVSANVVFQSTGKPITSASTIVTFEPKKYKALKKPLKIGIIGITRFNPTFLKSSPPKDNVIISNPTDELKKYVPELRKKVDQLVLLAAVPRDDAHVIAKEIPGIDLILGAYGGLTTAVEEKEGSTVIFYVGTQGKYLAELRFLQEEGLSKLNSNLHYLNTAYPEDPGMKAKVDAALADINNVGKAAAAQLAQPPVTGSAAATPASDDVKSFLTAEACKQCHQREYATWAESKHAHAMQTLVDKQADFNPDCINCHVVGFKKKGGFVDNASTHTLANVQCESCHGPGARHVANPGVPYGKAGQPSCLQCHTHEQSPSFNFATYWPKIQHGI